MMWTNMREPQPHCTTCEHHDRKDRQYPCNKCSSSHGAYNPQWMAKVTPRGIDIVMSCGEKHHVDTEQDEIVSVSLNGKQVYPQIKKK